jgi:CDP-glucose 4,6-dehydratase
VASREGAVEDLGVIKREFWRNKTVLVTGHTGFKGAWLSLWLRYLGAKVIGFSKGSVGSPSIFDSLKWDSGLVNIQGDVRDLKALEDLLSSHKPEIVFHLAAQSLVRLSYSDPIDTFTTNVIGTVNLLDSVRRAPSVRSVINITSDKCYDNREWPYAYRESDPMGGKDPYSCSKGCAELVTASYRGSFFDSSSSDPIGLASVRAGNVIGGGDWALDRLVPDCMVAFSKEEVAVVRNPHSIRPWQHVLDALGGYLLLAQSVTESPSLFSKGYNFGPLPTDTRPVSYVADKLSARWGGGASWRLVQAGDKVVSQADLLKEANFLRLDSSLAYNELKWRPVCVLDQALELTADWYKNYYSRVDITRFSLDQLEYFQGQLSSARSK